MDNRTEQQYQPQPNANAGRAMYPQGSSQGQYRMPQQQQYPQQQYPQQQYPQQQMPATMPAITIVNSNANTNTNINEMEQYSGKSKMVALLLAIFLGWLGIHRFYVGKIGTGIIWACSVGLLGIGWIADIVMIIIGSFRDKNGYRLR